MGNSPQQQTVSNRRRIPKPIGCCLVTPAIVVLILILVFTINNRPSDIVVPTHAVPADNGLNYLHQAYLLSKSMHHPSPYSMPGPPAQILTFANFQGCAEDAKPALDMLQQALDKPFMFPPQRSSKDPFFPQLAEFRELARVNAGAADYYAVSGQPGKAMEMRLNGMEMAVSIPRGGVMIHDLVSIACEAISVSRVEPLLPQLSAAELKRAAEHIDRIAKKRVPYGDIILEEGYCSTSLLQEQLKKIGMSRAGLSEANDAIGVDYSDPKMTVGEKARSVTAVLKFLAKSKRAMLAQNLEWYKALAREADGPYIGKSRIAVPDNIFAEMTGPLFVQARSKHAAMGAALAVLQVEVALYRYKATHGTFPAALKDLSPQFLPSLPDDPCGGGAGTPLQYRLQSESAFSLYSLGTDLVDNGGTPGRYLGDGQGDIVAGKLYRKGPILYSGNGNAQ